MSNKTDLQELNQNYSNLIETLKNKSLGGNEIELCEVVISGVSANYYPTDVVYTTLDENGNIIYKYDTCTTNSITVNCIKNHILTVKFKSMVTTNLISNKDILFYDNIMICFKIEASTTIENQHSHSGGI